MTLRLALAVVLAVLGCRDESRPAAHDLPRAWSDAAVDDATGGRYLPAARAVLRARQARVHAARQPVLHPHYADPSLVLVAVKTGFIETGARERLAALLAHEATDPALRVLALVDDAPARIAAALDLGEASARIDWLRAPPAPTPVTFQFVRDYAPLVVSVPEGEGFRATALAVYHGPTLNQVVDARLGVRRDRDPEAARARQALSRFLADAYHERLGALPLLDLEVRLDGGNLLSDGRGTCFATRVLLPQNGEDRAQVDRELARVGCLRVVLLAAPGRLDFVQHVDTLLYVADPENLVLSMPDGSEADRGAEFQNLQILLEEGYTVHRVARPSASITYTNVLTTRAHVYLPQYTRYQVPSARQRAIDARIAALRRAGRDAQAARLLAQPVDVETVSGGPALAAANQHAREVFARVTPGRVVVPVPSDATNESRGSWHCYTHEVPAPAP